MIKIIHIRPLNVGLCDKTETGNKTTPSYSCLVYLNRDQLMQDITNLAEHAQAKAPFHSLVKSTGMSDY